MAFLEEWFEQGKNVVLSPSEFYRDAERHEGFEYPVKFAVVSFLVGGLLSGTVNALFQSFGPSFMRTAPTAGPATTVLSTVAAAVVGGIIWLFVGGGLIHLFVYLFDGQGYEDTIEALSYPTAVSAFLGWIPVINLFAGFYALYVQARGIESFQDLTFGKALASVLLPLVLFIVIGLLMALVMGAAFTSPMLWG